MTDMSLIKEVSAGVFYTSQSIVFADNDLLNFLKTTGKSTAVAR